MDASSSSAKTGSSPIPGPSMSTLLKRPLTLPDKKQQEQFKALKVLLIRSPSYHCPHILTSSKDEDNLSDSASDIYKSMAEELSAFSDAEPKDDDDEKGEHVVAALQ